eukprot:881372_1
MVTIHWMHNDMRCMLLCTSVKNRLCAFAHHRTCCHLDLDCSNIMLEDSSFEKDKDGHLRINPAITIKLCDFGVSEIFRNGFQCNKTDLSVDNASYAAPNVYFERMYDARSADMWSVGMIMFECLTGESLYKPMDVFVTEHDEFTTTFNGYSALHNGDLKRYLLQNIELKCFTTDSLHFLLNVLRIDERMRSKACDILQHTCMVQDVFCKIFETNSKEKHHTERKIIETKENNLFGFLCFVLALALANPADSLYIFICMDEKHVHSRLCFFCVPFLSLFLFRTSDCIYTFEYTSCIVLTS